MGDNPTVASGRLKKSSAREDARLPGGGAQFQGDAVGFFKELLAGNSPPVQLDALEESLKKGAELLAARAAGISVCVWRRHAGKTKLLCCAGFPEGGGGSLPGDGVHPGENLRTEPEPGLWRRAAVASGRLLNLGGERLGAGGRWQSRAVGWGVPGKMDGLLVACAGPGSPSGEPAWGWLEALAAHYTFLTKMALASWELAESRRRLEGEFSTLQMVAETITAHPDRPGDVLGAVVSIVARALKADLCAFLLYDEASGELAVQPGAYGLDGDEDALYRMPLTNAKSSSVRVFLSGTPIVSGDARKDPRFIADFAKKWGMHSLMVVPLTLENRRVGVMRVGSRKKDFFTQDHVRLVGLIAEEAVVLVETAILTGKLSEANQRLQQVNRIKDDFVSTVSHEFKTPLTSIKGFLAVILSGEAGALNPQQKQFLRIAVAACDRLAALVADLLDLSKLEGGVRMDFAPVPVPELLERCVQDYRYQARSRFIELKLAVPRARSTSSLAVPGALSRRVPGSPVAVQGDVKWLRQVLDNLVSNALKFTSAGGSVTLRCVPQGEMVRVSVEDTGAGIAPEDQKHVFEKFYRVVRKDVASPPGTGLGLAIAKYIVDRHEGKIWLESELGRGTKFYFVLPSSKLRAEEAAPE